MAPKPDLLTVEEAVTAALAGDQIKVVSDSRSLKTIKVMSAARADAQAAVHTILTKLKVKYESIIIKSASEFPVTQIYFGPKKFRIVYKPKRGAGSGAGAAVTKMAESAQALYAALVFNVLKRPMTIKDVNLENFRKASPTAITDEDFNKMVNQLPDDWVNSSIAGANALYRKYRSTGKKFTFHRGSPIVNQIEAAFKAINKNERAFGDLNKWSPADIYMVGNGFDPRVLQNERTLKGLNAKMFELIQQNMLIGVSLKKITTASGTIVNKNFPTDKKSVDAEYLGTQTQLESIDGYIKWGKSTTSKIQFRSFGGNASLTGWQGEVKGASANQGKVSLGPINYILKSHGVGVLPDSKDSASLAKQNTPQHAQTIAQMLVQYGAATDITETTRFVQSQSDKYRYSKYLVMLLMLKMQGLSKQKADEVVQDIYLYASSSTSNSAPYIKLT